MSNEVKHLPVRTEKSSALSRAFNWRNFGAEFDRLRQELDTVFEDFTRGFPKLAATEFPRSGAFLRPAVDMTERDNGFEINVELPGVEAKEIDVAIKDNVLTIKAEHKEESEKKEDNYHLSERRYGSYQRSLALPETVDETKISATLKNGVLTVALPKTAEAQKPAKKIDVKAA